MSPPAGILCMEESGTTEKERNRSEIFVKRGRGFRRRREADPVETASFVVFDA